MPAPDVSRWLVDGVPGGLVDPADRGLAYGDGLFETMAARDGAVRWIEYHLDRLAAGCRRLEIPMPDPELLREEICTHAPASGRAVVKLIITRGGGARGYAPPQDAVPTRILGIAPWPAHPDSHYTRGIRARMLALRLGENRELAGLKHLGRLEQVLAQRQLRGSGCDEGFLCDGRGFVVGGTACNVFAVAGSTVRTPRIERCGVSGVMRRLVLERCAELGIETEEGEMEPASLHAADELFVTNAVAGVRPVGHLDATAFAAGRVTRLLQRALGYAAEKEPAQDER